MPKTEEELQQEIELHERNYNRLGAGNSGLTRKPDPFKWAIQGLDVDGDDRLWVRLGYCPGIVYRVYDMSGDILFHVAVDFPFEVPDYNDWAIVIDAYGFLAYQGNPDDYSRVYMLSLVEAVSANQSNL